MLDLHRELKALKPDEPDEEIARDIQAIRQAQPGVRDEDILEQAKGLVQSEGKPAAPAAPAAMPAAPSRPEAPPSAPAAPAFTLPEPPPDRPDKITGNDAAIAALQGLAGLGDAIATGYGGTKTDFLKTAMAADQQARENRTVRQKLIADRMKEGREGQKAQLEALLKGSKDRFEMEEKLRDSFSAQAKTFATVRDQYGVLQAAAQDPSAAGDISLLMAYMKLVDPGSTVREGEFANAAAAAGLPERLVGLAQRVDSGQRLSPAQRADFVGQAGKLFGTHQQTFEASKRVYDDLATAYGLTPKNVTSIVVGDAPKGAGGKVKVSNGTETLWIDPKDEAAAAKDGFKRVR